MGEGWNLGATSEPQGAVAIDTGAKGEPPTLRAGRVACLGRLLIGCMLRLDRFPPVKHFPFPQDFGGYHKQLSRNALA